MKPYLESIRRMSRVGLVLLTLSAVASVIVAMQYCTQEYIAELPRMSSMFFPLVVFTYLGGLTLALEGFSFLNKRADSDYYHALPVSRKQLFWSVTLAGLTWIAATVLISVVLTTLVYTFAKVSFVSLYPLVAVPFYTLAAMLVFAAAAIATSITGTLLTDIGLSAIVLGLIRFIQFCVARGVIAKGIVINWLDLPWYLTPVTNIATGQIAMLTRRVLDAQIYSFGNIGYSALLLLAELFIASLLFAKRPSELAEHGARNAKTQTLFACLSVLPVTVLVASGVVQPTFTSILFIATISIGIYVIYQIAVLRSQRKVLVMLPWILIPIALGVAALFGTSSLTTAMQKDIPSVDEVAYVQFGGSRRGTDYISYQQYAVSNVRFTEPDVIRYAVTSLRENVDSIEKNGYVFYEYEEPTMSYSIAEPVTFVLKNGRKISRVVTFQSQNMLFAIREENPEYIAAIRSLPPKDSVCYLQGEGHKEEAFIQSAALLRTFYDEIPGSGVITDQQYIIYDQNVMYPTDEQQTIGSITTAGYVGMQRYQNYNSIRFDLPKTASAWMQLKNLRSTPEHLDLLEQITKKSAEFINDSDYLDCMFTFYNVPMSNGAMQTHQFNYNRGRYYQSDDVYLTQIQPIVLELAQILGRSLPASDPNTMFVYVSWSGRALGEDGAYIGADVMAEYAASYGNGIATNGSIYYSSNGSAEYSIDNGSIISYNPSYRAFTAEDEARVIKLLKQWQQLQKELLYVGFDLPEEVIIAD